MDPGDESLPGQHGEGIGRVYIMAKMSLLITPEICTGCRACQVACKAWNQLPAEKTKFTGDFGSPSDLTGNTYNRVNFTEMPSEKNPVRWLFVSQRCMHCEDAGCMKICPTPGALYRTKDGAVATDKEKCIGCHLCLAACPFNVPRYGADGKLGKCTMCSDRTENGMIPACAKTCPTGAITYGDRDHLIARAQKMGYAKVYGQNELGGLGTLFAFKDAPKIYGYADKPVINEMVIVWHKYLKPASWLGIGAVTALSAIHYLTVGPHKEEDPNKKEGKDETK
jgi:formate dehydrogenase iron-sulfur subunit